MALKGDLSTIGLAEVFQMISMSQKQGTLVVQDTDSRKCIYFGETGVKLLSTGKRKGMRLGDMLVRAGKISEMSLQDALENAKIQKKLLGEVLVENGILAEDDIQGVVRSQIEEEIYDLFVWKKAIFEFIEGPPSDALRDPEAPVTQLSFDVNGLLLEAVRRADEWNIINQKIPSFDSIFVFVSESDRVEEEKSAPDQLRRVFRLIDGQASVADLVDATGISRFEVCKALMELVDRGRIRLLTVHEIMDVAAKHMTGGRRDKAVRLYQAAASQAPKDPKVIIGVARILEGESLNKEAAVNYARAGRLLLEQGNAGRAVEYLQKALSLNPEDGEVRMAMFEVYAATGDLEAGKKIALELVAQALMAPDYPRTRMLCERVLAADPEDLAFRVPYVKVLHRTGQKREAEEQLALIRKNMPADPAVAEKILRDLKEVMGPPSGVKRPTAAVRPVPRKRGKGRAVAVLFALLVLGGLGFAAKFEMEARREIKRIAEESKTLADKARFEEARRLLEDFLGSYYRYSPFQEEKARELLAQLDAQKKTWEDSKARERAEELENLRGKVVRLREEVTRLSIRSVSDALKKLEELRVAISNRPEFREDSQWAADQDRGLRDRAREADDLLQRGGKLEEEGKYKEASELYDRIVNQFYNTDAYVGIKYPLGIRTRPAGVTVTNIKVQPPSLQGMTGEGPLKLHVKPSEVVRLRFEKEGYQPVEKDIQNKSVGWLDVELTEKRDLWMLPLGVKADHAPVLAGDILYLAVSNKLYALAAGREKALVWPGPETVEGQIEGPPRAANGLLYLGTSSGWVYALDPALPREKRTAWKYAAGDRVIGAVAISPAGNAVYACTAGRLLHAINAKDGQPLWKKDLPAEGAVGPACMPEGGILVSCQNGSLLALKGPQTTDELWRHEAGTGFGPILVDATGIFAVGADQQVYAIGLDGRSLWKKPAPGASLARPYRSGEVLYVGARVNVLFLSAATGESLGRFETQGTVQGGATGAGPLVFFGSDDGFLYAFEPSEGKMLWKFRSKGNIRTESAIGDGRLYVVSGDVVHAIELN